MKKYLLVVSGDMYNGDINHYCKTINETDLDNIKKVINKLNIIREHTDNKMYQGDIIDKANMNIDYYKELFGIEPENDHDLANDICNSLDVCPASLDYICDYQIHSITSIDIYEYISATKLF